jgi:hypothetical protein
MHFPLCSRFAIPYGCVVRIALAAMFVMTSIGWSRNAPAALIPSSREVTVNSVTTGAQLNPDVAVGVDESVLVVWEDNRFDNNGVHVRARKLGADLEPVAIDFQVDVANDTWNRAPDVARLGDGSFVVVWHAGIEGGSIRARRIGSDGSLVGDEFRIDTQLPLGTDPPVLGDPTIAAAADGGFVVAWPGGVRKSGYQLDTDVHVRAFTAAGEPKGDGIVIQSGYAERSENVDLRAGEIGFVLAWAAGSNASAPLARAETLDANGVPIGEQFANLGGPDPRVATWGDARFHVISTYPSQTPGIENVLARKFDQGVLGAPFVFTERTAGMYWLDRHDVAITALENGDVVVAWSHGDPNSSGDGSDAGLFAQVFDPKGYPIGDPRLLNEITQDAQIDPEIACVGDNRVVIVWESDVSAIAPYETGEVSVRVFEIRDLACGDATEDGAVTATDALLALGAAVGSIECATCLCDADGSGTTSASDALALLHTSVGLGADLACPQCPGGAGTGIELATDGECHGAHVEIPASALPAGGVDCTIDPYAKALPCVSSLSIDVDGLHLDVRDTSYDVEDCRLDAMTLLSCRGEEAAVAAMAEAAVVTCGCGCKAECVTPRVCVSSSESPTCSVPVNLSTAKAAHGTIPTAAAVEHGTKVAVSVTETAMAASSVSTTSFSCGTCCSTPVVGEIKLMDDVKVTELRVRLQGDVDSTCLACEAWGSEIVDRDDGTVEFCIFRPEGIQGPTVLSPCFGNVGSITPGPAEVLRARGENFEPIDAPTVVNEF